MRKQIAGLSWAGAPVAVPGYDRLRILEDAIIVKATRLQHLENRAMGTIQEWLKLCKNPVASFSCGKDSTVIFHLALNAKPDIRMVRHSSAEPHLPDVEQMMGYMRERYPGQVQEFIFGSLFELYHEYGLEDARIDAVYKRKVEAWERENGIDGALRGVRAEESRARKSLRQYSRIIRMQNDIWVCDPIIDWTADDVWSYIAWRGLPYCALYDLEDDRPRNLRRLGSIWGTSAAQYGRLAWLKKFYPEYFDMFAAEFPEVRCYV